MKQVLERLRQVPLRDQVAGAICNAILNGEIAPGDKIPESMLAEQLGTSRVPVREAIRILEQQGLVVTRPKAGTYVAALTEAELDDSMRLRAALEELAVEQALERLEVGAWAALCARLQELIGGMSAAVAQHDYPRVVELDYRWHSLIVEASANRTLAQIWQSLGLRIRLVLFRRMADRLGTRGWEATVTHHVELLAALRRRDRTECRAAARFHVLRRMLASDQSPLDRADAAALTAHAL